MDSYRRQQLADLGLAVWYERKHVLVHLISNSLPAHLADRLDLDSSCNFSLLPTAQGLGLLRLV